MRAGDMRHVCTCVYKHAAALECNIMIIFAEESVWVGMFPSTKAVKHGMGPATALLLPSDLCPTQCKLLKVQNRLVIMAHTFNPSTGETEAGRSGRLA